MQDNLFSTSVLGLQWGDEGKGKIVDFLSKDIDLVVRFQGGDNAGHTIECNNKVFKLSLLPSGIISGKKCFIGPGVVVNLSSLLSEIETLTSQGISVTSENLKIAENAVIIPNFYREIDAMLEGMRGINKIGTTKKGIGIAYSDKTLRKAIRICDIYDDGFLEEKVFQIVNYYNHLIKANNLPLLNGKDILADIKSSADKIKQFIVSSYQFTSSFKGNVLFEGAQGFGLDINYGTYPFVTSSSTVAGSIFTGSGFGFKAIDRNIGVVKAYSTRVGDGFFPTEGHGDFEKLLQQIGNEFGTVTKRKRRCGALDLPYAKQAAFLNGTNEIALTKIDVLDGFKEIPICVAYKVDGEEIDYLPSSIDKLSRIRPVYKVFEGWAKQGPTLGVNSFDKLPDNAKRYIDFIENYLKVKIGIISTGSHRDQTIVI
jgi:adenylosuccinate synthase